YNENVLPTVVVIIQKLRAKGREESGDGAGWKDIFVVGGMVFPQIDRFHTGITYPERNLLFHNQRDGKFEEVGMRSGPALAARKVSRGLAVADYDNDGSVEMMVSNMNDSPELIRHSRRNPNHAILVRTIGVHSNRDGIGAEVKVTAGGITQWDEVRSGGSYLSSSDLRLHFGVGSATTIERMEVHWPSGKTDVISDAPVDRVLTVKEGQGLIEAVPFAEPVKFPLAPAKKDRPKP
ncbi:MAG: CRTAC1 family protein, partial [Deltaproteobacteria bacterium]